jgi:hypothetical protein
MDEDSTDLVFSDRVPNVLPRQPVNLFFREGIKTEHIIGNQMKVYFYRILGNLIFETYEKCKQCVSN